MNNRLAKAAVVAVASMLLAGCGQQAGAAAIVGSTRITDSQVDAVARGLCSANTSGGSDVANLPSRGARSGALDVLLESELSRQFGAAKRVLPDEEQVSQALAATDPNVQSLPASERPAFHAALKAYAEGQLMLITIGKRSLRAQGQATVTQAQAVAQGTKLRNTYAKSLHVTVDPRFGTWVDNTLRFASGSLSVAQSLRATQGARSDPTSLWSAELPPSQTCG
ncbi:MAG: hypothetical protein ACRDPI_00615 [Nocardioidaceae bacterium]